MKYRDRSDAGRLLSTRLGDLAAGDPVVVGLPRGGVPVAFEVARALVAPLDVLLVRKLGLPYQPELAMGAIGEGSARVLNAAVVEACQVTAEQLDHVEERERAELDRRVRAYREPDAAVSLAGRTVVIVDDGAATGATARVACSVARARGASRIVVALPVASLEAIGGLRDVADDVVCPYVPTDLPAVGAAYADFAPTSDEDVRSLLTASRQWWVAAHGPAGSRVVSDGGSPAPGRLRRAGTV